MPKMFPSNIKQLPSGSLTMEETNPIFHNIYFIPSEEALKMANLVTNNPSQYKTLILDVNEQDNYASIYPINTKPYSQDFLKQKYKKIETITLVGFDYNLSEGFESIINDFETIDFPSGFIKDYNYGLGILNDYHFLIDILEEWNITHLVIHKSEQTKIAEDGYFILNYNDFENIRKSIDKISRQASNVSTNLKKLTTNNTLSDLLNDNPKYPKITLKIKDNAITRLVSRAVSSIETKPIEEEQLDAINTISKNKEIIAKEQPLAFIKLKDDIELVTLEQLIVKFGEKLEKSSKEEEWQTLFNENPFILTLAFGYPIIKIKDKAYVGGKKISNSGDKITDFLVKNKLTNNTSIVEIKTPNANLLNSTPYRDGVYTPTTDLSGAVNQVLDQKFKFQKDISSIKENSGMYDIKTFQVQCVLIIGMMPKEEDKLKSFELFRGNSKDVIIITFDELLEKLKTLKDFLASKDVEQGQNECQK